MRWSFRLLRVFGIDIRIHVSFFLILIWGAMMWSAAGSAGMAFGVLEVVLLFVCVVLHELGHSIVAKHYGIPVREIVLLPIGGVSMMSRNASRPLHELLIALAGPAVNVVIAAALFALLALTPLRSRVDLHALAAGNVRPGGVSMLLLLLSLNVMLALFNLIPAFPLDGGRVLRAVLAMRMPAPSATRVAAMVGQMAAVLLGLWGLFSGNVFLLFVAAFIFIGAGAENAQVQNRATFTGRRIGDTYNRHALTLSIDDRVSRVVDYLLTSYQPDFAVVQRGKLEGVVRREDVLRWLAGNSYDVYVTEIMHAADVPHVDARLSVEQVREKMEEAGSRLVAVYDRGTYLGLVSSEDLAEAQLVLTFVERSGLRRREPPLKDAAAAEWPEENRNAVPQTVDALTDGKPSETVEPPTEDRGLPL